MSAPVWELMQSHPMIPLPLLADAWGITYDALTNIAAREGRTIYHRVVGASFARKPQVEAELQALDDLIGSSTGEVTGWVEWAGLQLGNGNWTSIHARRLLPDGGKWIDARVKQDGQQGPYCVRRREVEWLARQLDREIPPEVAPAIRSASPFPDWAPAEALLAMLDVNDPNYAPELAGAIRAWCALYFGAGEGRRNALGEDDVRNLLGPSWSASHGRLRPAMSDRTITRISRVCRPGGTRKTGGRPPGTR